MHYEFSENWLWEALYVCVKHTWFCLAMHQNLSEKSPSCSTRQPSISIQMACGANPKKHWALTPFNLLRAPFLMHRPWMSEWPVPENENVLWSITWEMAIALAPTCSVCVLMDVYWLKSMNFVDDASSGPNDRAAERNGPDRGNGNSCIRKCRNNGLDLGRGSFHGKQASFSHFFLLL